MIIKLPYNFKLREYQSGIWKAFFEEKKKRFVNVWHRRSGKDTTWLQILVAASQLRIGTYLYTLPKLTQARKVVWNGIRGDGKRFLDCIPKEFILGKPNSVDMTIKLKNGSIIMLGGADNYDALMGTNPVGIIHSEFSLQNPKAWDFLRPILSENGGWAAFIYTPRGTNHGYDMYNMASKNPDWYCNLLTVDDTKKSNGDSVISSKIVEEARDGGMSEDMVQQEFYCSWTAAVRGAYFSRELQKAQDSGRIKVFAIDNTQPVFTSWDLGIGDSNCIWLFQYIEGIPHAIWYYENNGKKLQHYVNFLMDLRNKFDFVFSCHFLPHDGAKRSLQTGKPHINYLKDLGLSPVVKVKKCKKKPIAIEAARVFLDKVVIHKINCAHGLSCLREYHAEYYEKANVYSNNPAHNWASHGADAFMTYAQYSSTHRDSLPGRNKTIENVLDQFSL